MFWLLKIVVAIALANGAGTVVLEKASTNEAPGVWADQPGTIPVCSSGDDAKRLMEAFVEPSDEWTLKGARQRLSVSMSMDVESCHLERLPTGVTEAEYFVYLLDSPGYRDIFASPGQDMTISHGVAAVVTENAGVTAYTVLTETEATVRAYGMLQYLVGKDHGFGEGFAAGIVTQMVPGEPDPGPMEETPRAGLREL